MNHDLVSTAVLVTAMALAGLVFGLAYFTALRRTVDLYCSGGRPLGAVLATIGRIVAGAVLLALAAGLGALPLLATFLGFLAARALALRRAVRSR